MDVDQHQEMQHQLIIAETLKIEAETAKIESEIKLMKIKGVVYPIFCVCGVVVWVAWMWGMWK